MFSSRALPNPLPSFPEFEPGSSDSRDSSGCKELQRCGFASPRCPARAHPRSLLRRARVTVTLSHVRCALLSLSSWWRVSLWNNCFMHHWEGRGGVASVRRAASVWHVTQRSVPTEGSLCQGSARASQRARRFLFVGGRSWVRFYRLVWQTWRMSTSKVCVPCGAVSLFSSFHEKIAPASRALELPARTLAQFP